MAILLLLLLQLLLLLLLLLLINFLLATFDAFDLFCKFPLPFKNVDEDE